MSIDTDYEVLRKALGHTRPGWAAEFGVYSGFSLAIISEHMPVIGFDSFEGLPEDWREGFPKGKFAYAPGRYINAQPRQMLVPGWFSETVPGFPFPPLSLVHIDCDLYSSTVTALDGVRPHIHEGTVVVFDEFHGYEGWEKHEAKAWDEFCTEHEVTASLIDAGPEEASFLITGIGAR